MMPVGSTERCSATGSCNKIPNSQRTRKSAACARCRQRRSRCIIDEIGQPCRLCLRQGVRCPSVIAAGKPVHPKIGFLQREQSETSSMEDDSYLVGPLLARDTQVLDHHFSQVDAITDTRLGIISPDPLNPVYRATVPPPRPKSQYDHDDLSQRLVKEVEPFANELMAAFYERFHPCFPITDEGWILSRLTRGTLPQTLRVVLTTYALSFWDHFPSMAIYSRPDQEAACQACTSVINADIHRGDLITIIAICINVAARPSRCLIHNVANVARAVALSHAIGLNHDCGQWQQITDIEKRTRWKAWWGVLIHDRWFNFAQGTPPHISKSQYEVPLPTLELLLGDVEAAPRTHLLSAEIFIHLCRLTECLGDVLPLLYVTGSQVGLTEKASQLEVELDRWMRTGPSWLNLDDFERPQIPGIVNLQISYLAVRMLLRRLAWHGAGMNETSALHLSRCHASAQMMARWILGLDRNELTGFWLPYHANHFISAMTLLLRCALQTDCGDLRDQCFLEARSILDCLKMYETDYQWDIATSALSQSANLLEKINRYLSHTSVLQADTSDYEGTTVGARHAETYFLSSFGQISIESLFPELFPDFNEPVLGYEAYPGFAEC